MTDGEKKEAIQAKRGPLEHEQFAAQLDVKVAKEHEDEALLAEPTERLERIERQLKALDEEEKKLG